MVSSQSSAIDSIVSSHTIVFTKVKGGTTIFAAVLPEIVQQFPGILQLEIRRHFENKSATSVNEACTCQVKTYLGLHSPHKKQKKTMDMLTLQSGNTYCVREKQYLIYMYISYLRTFIGKWYIILRSQTSDITFAIKSAFDVKSAFRYHFCYQKRFW